MPALALARGAPMPTKPRASSREVVLSASQGRVNKVSSRLADRGHRSTCGGGRRFCFAASCSALFPLALTPTSSPPPPTGRREEEDEDDDEAPAAPRPPRLPVRGLDAQPGRPQRVQPLGEVSDTAASGR